MLTPNIQSVFYYFFLKVCQEPEYRRKFSVKGTLSTSPPVVTHHLSWPLTHFLSSLGFVLSVCEYLYFCYPCPCVCMRIAARSWHWMSSLITYFFWDIVAPSFGLTDWLIDYWVSPAPKLQECAYMVAGGGGANPGPHVWEAHYWRNHLPCSRLWSWLDHPLFPYPKRHVFCLDLFLLKIDIPRCADVDVATVLQPKKCQNHRCYKMRTFEEFLKIRLCLECCVLRLYKILRSALGRHPVDKHSCTPAELEYLLGAKTTKTP